MTRFKRRSLKILSFFKQFGWAYEFWHFQQPYSLRRAPLTERCLVEDRKTLLRLAYFDVYTYTTLFARDNRTWIVDKNYSAKSGYDFFIQI